MPRDVLYMFVEPGYGNSSWFSKSSAGLLATAARREIPVAQLRQLAEIRQHPGMTRAVIIGAGEGWTRTMIGGLRERGVKSVLVGCSPQDFGEDVSGPTFDRRALVMRMVSYFYHTGRKRLACVGSKLEDANDELRKLAFLSGARKLGLKVSEKDVFEGAGDLAPIVEAFLDRAGEYDGAVCVNDQTAVQLIGAAQRRGIRVPEDLFVAGSGDCIIGSLTTPSLTTSTMDYYQMGVQAVYVWNYLGKNPMIDALCVTLPSQIICRGSTGFARQDPLSAAAHGSRPAAPALDGDFERLDRIENCLMRCDELDFGILRGMLTGRSAEQIALELFVSHGTVSYRARKLYRHMGVQSRAAFLNLIAPWVTNLAALEDRLPGRIPHDSLILS